MIRATAQTIARRSATFAGELWALAAVVGYTGSNLFGRAGVALGNPVAGPLLRDLPSFLLGLSLLSRAGRYRQLLPGRSAFQGAKLVPFVLSGAISVIGTFAFFFSLSIGGVNIAVPVLQTQLLWGALFGWLLLGERVLPRGVFGIAVTFAGLCVLAVGQSRGTPVSDAWFTALLLALVPAVAWGLSGVIWRRGQMQGVERSAGMTVHYGTSVLVSLSFLIIARQLDVYRALGWESLVSLVMSGICGGVIAAFAMFTAIKLLPAATVFVLNGLTPLLTAVGGAWFLGEYVNPLMWAGIALTSLGVVVFQVTKPVRVGAPVVPADVPADVPAAGAPGAPGAATAAPASDPRPGRRRP
ncbi:MAG: DMT family transporter [Trueperaceae bacterium]|nr:DMT family transporter [Trueperaceae bacterium]MCC6309766.1 DMT family transporter [Trueperaceae bacterium]MCO5175267.1 DMT family transporter [Trueperaceae bacterium]